MTDSQQPPDPPPRHLTPQRRRFRPPIGKGRGRRDPIEPAAAIGGAVAGGLFGDLIGAAVGIGHLGILFGAVIGYTVLRVIVGGSGRLLERWQNGATTPHKPDYSVPQSLATRGEFERAIDAYEEYVWASPEAPDPYVSIARLYRDKLDRPEDAEGWFKRARTESKMPAGLDLLVTQELVELYLHRLKAPRKAIPELAHICSAHPNTPAAQAAEQELQELREMLAQESEGAGSVTQQYLKKHSPRRRH